MWRCPDCSKGRLNETLRMEFGPDGSNDENRLTTTECDSCDFKGLVTFEESRRGLLDSDGAYHHDGWRVKREVFDQVKKSMLACPQPKYEGCGCSTHAWLHRGGG